MFASCPTRLAPLTLGGSLLLLALGCGPNESDDPIDFDEARDGLHVDEGMLQGHFESRIWTMLDGTTKITHHVKFGPWGQREVYEIDLPEGTEAPEYDSFVRVYGRSDGDHRWETDDLVVVSPPPQPLIDAEPRPPRRIGTVLVFWDGTQGLPNAEAADDMYTGTKSTNVYYNENSYGMEYMAGKTFGPYMIDNPGGCNTDFISNQADQAMIEKGWDPSDYRQMMYHFPGGLGCGFAGLASIGSPDNPARNSWYSGSFGCTTRNQELGHNYGMGHSHAYSCPPEPPGMDHNLYEDCEHIEYGHPYDPMGNGCGHMNITQKTYMGWIDECNVLTATSDGIYNLLPTEWPCNGTQALVWPAYDGRYYHIEFRNGDGEFVAGNGVLVNIAPQVQSFGPTGYVLDELGSLNNGFLHQGDSFTDPGGAGTMTILEEDMDHVVIQLELPGGGDGQPATCRGGGSPVEEGGVIGSTECTGAVHPSDEAAPEALITYPIDGDWFPAGSDFTITAELTDDVAVVEAELCLNGDSFNVITQPPWEWQAVGIPAGTYEFGVVARDARHWTPSNAVTIQVGGTPPEPETTGGSDTGEPPVDTDGDADTDGADGSTGGETVGEVEEPDSCACRSGRGNAGGLGFGAMLLGLAWLRRRND